jgi:hypothetical protein
MIYVSPPFIEVGVFDAEEAEKVAVEIIDGIYQSKATLHSGRLVVAEAVNPDIEARIDLITKEDILGATDRQELRTRTYAQILDEINEKKFPGLPWHVDYVGNPYVNSKLMEFSFGSSSHPTQYFVGSVDFEGVAENIREELSEAFEDDAVFELPSLLMLGGSLIQNAIDESVAIGAGQIVEAHPGVLYKIPKGSIHKMQDFNPDDEHAPRFCIEKYLKPRKQ